MDRVVGQITVWVLRGGVKNTLIFHTAVMVTMSHRSLLKEQMLSGGVKNPLITHTDVVVTQIIVKRVLGAFYWKTPYLSHSHRCTSSPRGTQKGFIVLFVCVCVSAGELCRLRPLGDLHSAGREATGHRSLPVRHQTDGRHTCCC